MKSGILFMSLLLTVSIPLAHGSEVDYADVKCFVLDEYKTKDLVPFRMNDRTNNEITGFIAAVPFLTSKHLKLTEVTIGRSVGGTKRGKALLRIPLNDEGRILLEQYTNTYVGRRVAIFTGKELVAAPQIMEKYSGPLPLEGGYTDEEAEHIVKVLKGRK